MHQQKGMDHQTFRNLGNITKQTHSPEITQTTTTNLLTTGGQNNLLPKPSKTWKSHNCNHNQAQ